MWEWNYKESWVLKKWCFWTVVLEKTLESPLDSKEIQPAHPKGDQSWVFTGRTDVEAETPIMWPSHAKSWLIGKDPDAEKDWGQEEKGTTEHEMFGWHHRLNGPEFEDSPGDGEGQGNLVLLQSIESQRVRRYWATALNWIWNLPYWTPTSYSFEKVVITICWIFPQKSIPMMKEVNLELRREVFCKAV